MEGKANGQCQPISIPGDLPDIDDALVQLNQPRVEQVGPCMFAVEKAKEEQAPGRKIYSTGAQRSNVGDDARYDLVSELGLERLAQTYCEGTKHGEHNWRKGMPFSDLFNRVMRHINKYKMGDMSEDHLAHAAWGLFALMEQETTHPEMNDLFYANTR